MIFSLSLSLFLPHAFYPTCTHTNPAPSSQLTTASHSSALTQPPRQLNSHQPDPPLAYLRPASLLPDQPKPGKQISHFPPYIAAYSIFHLVSDLIAFIDTLSQDQVFVVGHNWGALVAWNLCAFRPDKVKAPVNLGVAYMPQNPAVKSLDGFRAIYGNDLYIYRFQEPGEVGAQFAQVDTPLLMKILFTLFSLQPLFIPEKGFIGRLSNYIAFLAF